MKVKLDNYFKCQIDKNELKKLSIKSDWQGIKHVCIFFISLIFFGCLAYISWGTWWSVLWFFIYGNIYHFSNPITHETKHNTAFKTKFLNKLFFQISCFMASTEPTRWRNTHFMHHSSTLSTHDPYDYEIQVTKPTDLLFFFANIIPFGKLIILHKTTHFDTLKIALGIHTDVMKDCIPEKEQAISRFVARVHVGIWIAIIMVSIAYQTWLPVLYLVLPLFYGNTLFQLLGTTQHAGLLTDTKDHRLSTRTVYLNPIFSFLYYHMEYHIEHHMFPTVPAHNLSKLHQLIKHQMPKPKKGLWNAYREIIPVIFRQASDPNYKMNIILPAK